MQRLAEKTSVRRGWRAVTARVRLMKREVGDIDERHLQRGISGYGLDAPATEAGSRRCAGNFRRMSMNFTSRLLQKQNKFPAARVTASGHFHPLKKAAFPRYLCAWPSSR
ncbi:MAG: hypothetical protein ACRYHA_27990 [Janthinobacterium lividum]